MNNLTQPIITNLYKNISTNAIAFNQMKTLDAMPAIYNEPSYFYYAAIALAIGGISLYTYQKQATESVQGIMTALGNHTKTSEALVSISNDETHTEMVLHQAPKETYENSINTALKLNLGLGSIAPIMAAIAIAISLTTAAPILPLTIGIVATSAILTQINIFLMNKKHNEAIDKYNEIFSMSELNVDSFTLKSDLINPNIALITAVSFFVAASFLLPPVGLLSTAVAISFLPLISTYYIDSNHHKSVVKHMEANHELHRPASMFAENQNHSDNDIDEANENHGPKVL